MSSTKTLRIHQPSIQTCVESKYLKFISWYDNPQLVITLVITTYINTQLSSSCHRWSYTITEVMYFSSNPKYFSICLNTLNHISLGWEITGWPLNLNTPANWTWRQVATTCWPPNSWSVIIPVTLHRTSDNSATQYSLHPTLTQAPLRHSAPLQWTCAACMHHVRHRRCYCRPAHLHINGQPPSRFSDSQAAAT